MGKGKIKSWNKAKIILPCDYNFLILVTEHTCMIFATTYVAKNFLIQGNLCLLTLIIRESRVLKTKQSLRTRGSFRISKGCYFWGPWDKSEPPQHLRWNRFPMTYPSGHIKFNLYISWLLSTTLRWWDIFSLAPWMCAIWICSQSCRAFMVGSPF